MASAPPPGKSSSSVVSSQHSSQYNDNTIESQAGEISGEYACVYEGVNGVLYAGSKALYFVGTYFLFDKKIRLPWEIIRRVVKMDQGVCILTNQQPEAAIHTFSSLHQPSRVWPVLIGLHNDALLDRPAPVKRDKSYKRRNSDPPSKGVVTLDNLDASEAIWLKPSGGAGTPDTKKNKAHYKRAETAPLATAREESPSPRHPTSSSPLQQHVNVAGLSAAEVEDKLGEIKLAPIPCTYDNMRGTLYAGNKGLYFFGKKFFWDIKRLHFPFGTVRQVQIIQTPSTHNGEAAAANGEQQPPSERQGICLTTKEGTQYEFDEIENPDKVWASLLAVHNDILTERHHVRGGSGGGGTHRGSFVRMNSDPNLAVRSASSSSLHDEKPAAVPAKRNHKQQRRQLSPNRQPQEPPKNQPQQQHEPSGDMAKEWAAMVANKAYPNLIVDKLALGCSLNQFHKLFLANDAEHSSAKFLESRGDSSLQASQWKADGGSSSSHPAIQNQTRVIHYSHPVNAPLAPPRAGARKEQRLTRFGDYGMCLETRTIVDDVPMADCFHVDDRIRILANGPKSVSVTMEFQITFIKSTMFKSIISKTTQAEFSDFFRQLANYMTRALGGKPSLEVARAPASASRPGLFSTLRGGMASIKLTAIHPFLTVMVMLLQLFVFQELRAMRQQVTALTTALQSPPVCPQIDGSLPLATIEPQEDTEQLDSSY